MSQEADIYSVFDRVLHTDPTVYAMRKNGSSLENIIVALVREKQRFIDRIIELEGLAPRRIVLPDGSCLIWRCPDHLVPETLIKT